MSLLIRADAVIWEIIPYLYNSSDLREKACDTQSVFVP